MDRLEEFLKELSELTQKHGFVIGGCGCCGSPWIGDFKNEFDADELHYNDKKQKYEVEHLCIIKKGGETDA